MLVSLVVGLTPGHTFGQSIAIRKDQAFEAQTVLLPYGFYNENLKLGLGAAFVTNGWLQKQMALIATGFVTTNGSRSTFLLGRDTAIPVLTSSTTTASRERPPGRASTGCGST